MKPKQKYRFRTRPYKHQRDAWRASRNELQYALFCEMGTGKTKILIDTACWLHLRGKVDTLFVIAPKGVYTNWIKEIDTHMPKEYKGVVHQWKNGKWKTTWHQPDGNGLAIYLINVEAFSTGKGTAASRKVVDMYTMIAIDESTTIKNPRAKRTKNIISLSKETKYKRIMSGAPITRSPLDLYSQCEFLNKKLLGHTSFYTFRNDYAIVVKRHLKSRTFDEVVGYQNLERLNEILGRFSYRILKEECLDLPPKIYQRYEVEMTPMQVRLYEQMRQLSFALLEKEEMVTATIALVKILRLHQIVCGFTRTDKKVLVDIESNRMKALIGILDTVGKAIIWSGYTHCIRNMVTEIKKAYGENSVVSYYGETPDAERLIAIDRFNNVPECRFFVGNPSTAGFGLTLVAANTVVYYSNGYDLEYRMQSEDRAHRIGQTKAVNYIDMVTPGTVDEMILEALRNKKDLADMVVDGKWRDFLGGQRVREVSGDSVGVQEDQYRGEGTGGDIEAPRNTIAEGVDDFEGDRGRYQTAEWDPF